LTHTDEKFDRQDRDWSSQRPALDQVCEHLPAVRRIVFPMVLDHQHADDLTQEIMIRAIRGLNGFKGQSSLKTWLTRIALNTTYTFLERRKRVSDSELPAAPVDRSFDGSPIHAAIGKELDAEIQAALQKLSAKLRAAIVLTAIDGLTPAEAAAIEECSLPTMHWRIHQARKDLRQHLKAYVDVGDVKQ
jgi:RNA polymerase sigma-70 factor (ECF subfamily)